jgi:hypothetical protein
MIDISRKTLPTRVKALEDVVEGLIDEFRRWLDDANEYQAHLQNILDMLERFVVDQGDVEPPSLEDEVPF